MGGVCGGKAAIDGELLSWLLLSRFLSSRTSWGELPLGAGEASPEDVAKVECRARSISLGMPWWKGCAGAKNSP